MRFTKDTLVSIQNDLKAEHTSYTYFGEDKALSGYIWKLYNDRYNPYLMFNNSYDDSFIKVETVVKIQDVSIKNDQVGGYRGRPKRLTAESFFRSLRKSLRTKDKILCPENFKNYCRSKILLKVMLKKNKIHY